MIADGLGMELEVVKTAWDGLPMAVLSGDIDAIIAGMSPTAERQQTLDFSDPYYESDLVVVVRKDGAYAAATQLSDFTGARITASSTPSTTPSSIRSPAWSRRPRWRPSRR